MMSLVCAHQLRLSEPASRSRSAAELIGASGLRNSCASMARNSSLRRLAARSSLFALTADGDVVAFHEDAR